MIMMDQLDLQGKRVLIREDFNVPMANGNITHTARIDAALPTIQKALKNGAKIILMSHLGRPKAGQFTAEYSLQPVADYLSQCLGQKVPLFQLNEKIALSAGQVALLENVRFLTGEEENDPNLAQKLAALADIFVMDAFAVAHRAQASTVGVAQYAPIACAGPLLHQELAAIHQVLESPQKPILAIVGGSKISTKLNILKHVLSKVDVLVVGGGIANTFLAAKGYPVGDSLYEKDLLPIAQNLMNQAALAHKQIWLPTDVVVGTELSAQAQALIKAANAVLPGEKIFDIGPQSQSQLAQLISQAQTILWNGPVGVFECAPFAPGTHKLAQAIAQSKAFTVAGGGDTLAAIEQFAVSEKISYLSTGGGAFLEALEGKTLPAVAALLTRAKEANAMPYAR